MIGMFNRVTMRNGFTVAIFLAAAAPAFAQQPTDAQRSAIRSSCRADYQANCASVPPGGMASLQCLQKNMANLSAACQHAVSAIEPAAPEPKAESASPAPPPSSPAAAPPAPAATTTTAPPPPTPKATTTAPAAKSKDAGSNTSAPAATRPPPTAATASPATTPAPIAAPAPVMVLRPMRPREELFVLRSACGGDVRAICGGVDPGGGRIVQCLAANAPALSPACKEVLGQFAAQ